jgi:adenosylmethionine-8-amino-7-oxononanoate aminotransferase
VHGFTYSAHPVAVAAGSAVLAVISEGGLIERADSDRDDSAGTAMKSELQRLYRCEAVGNVRGLGLLWGVEFVAEKTSKAPFAPSLQFSALVAATAAKRGVMTYPMQGCVDGERGDHLLLAPPAIIARDEIAWAVGELAAAIDQVHNEVTSR